MKSFSNEAQIFFFSESSGPPIFQIYLKHDELCECCYRNPLETLE